LTILEKKILLIVLDGATDRPVPDLGGLTPFQAARTPNLDTLARDGCCGIMDVVRSGYVPGSDTAQMSLLTYNPFKYYNGRGALEALGGGIDVQPGDVCFRANLSTVKEDKDGRLIVVDRRAGRYIPEAKEIEKMLQQFTPPFKDVEIKFVHTTQHRCAFLIRGQNISSSIIDTDPHKVPSPLHELLPIPGDEASLRTVKITKAFQEFVYNTLKDHPINDARRSSGRPPVNMVLLRSPSGLPKLSPFKEKNGIDAAFVCGNALIAGVCLAAKLEPMMMKDDLNFEKKVEMTFKALENHDFVFLHLKETDNLSHDHEAKKVVKILEDFDAKVIGKILNLDPESHVIALTTDHATPCVVGEHTGDPVPILIHSANLRNDNVKNFDEKSCRKGILGRIAGGNLVYILMDAAGRLRKSYIKSINMIPVD